VLWCNSAVCNVFDQYSEIRVRKGDFVYGVLSSLGQPGTAILRRIELARDVVQSKSVYPCRSDREPGESRKRQPGPQDPIPARLQLHSEVEATLVVL
jgi:hypothetical protein